MSSVGRKEIKDRKGSSRNQYVIRIQANAFFASTGLFSAIPIVLFSAFSPKSMPCKMLNRSIIEKPILMLGMYKASPSTTDGPRSMF